MEINDISTKGMPCKVCNKPVTKNVHGLRYTHKESGNVIWWPHHFECLPETTYPDPVTEMCELCGCAEEHHDVVLMSDNSVGFCVGPNCSGSAEKTCQQKYSSGEPRKMGPRI